MKGLITVVGFAILSMACGSDLRTAPAPVPQPAEPAVPTGFGPYVVAATRILVGEVVQSAIEARDPECFRAWDARGRCRAYELIVPTAGELLATLTGTGPSRGELNPEVFVVAPDGNWSYSPDGWPERHASLSASSGLTYHVVVISYGPFPDAFALKVDVR